MKRRGFTLIELMVVIAIIIILAAIAIPNYLKMTERAKKSRIASDMATLATGLETFKTDWGNYPVAANEAIDTATNDIFIELAGTDTDQSHRNSSDNTNSLGEKGPLEYLKAATLTSIIDPFSTGAAAPADGHIYYTDDGTGVHWLLYAYSSGPAATGQYLYRSDGSSTVTEHATVAGAPAITVAGVITY